MRCRSMLYVCATVGVTACNRDVSMPKALEIANDAEQKLWQGWNREVMTQLRMMEPASNFGWPDPDRSRIDFVKDDATERFNAVVIERLFIPPEGQGAPLSRRSLVVWRPDASYGVLALTETNADTAGLLADLDKDLWPDALNPRSLFVAPHASDGDWWLGRSGKVFIAPLATGSKCPFGNGGGDAEDDTSRRVTCDVVSFAVRVDGELVRRQDLRNPLLPEALKPRHHIAIAEQKVNGIRFTIQCHPTELILMTPIYSECNNNPLMFWRTNELFAISLGVDVKQMKRTTDRMDPGVYGRTLIQGSEKSPGGNREIRYTVSFPDGTIMERGSADFAYNLPAGQIWLEQCALGMGYGGRRQCLAVQIGDPKMQSRYGVFVVDMEEGPRQ